MELKWSKVRVDSVRNVGAKMVILYYSYRDDQVLNYSQNHFLVTAEYMLVVLCCKLFDVS